MHRVHPIVPAVEGGVHEVVMVLEDGNTGPAARVPHAHGLIPAPTCHLRAICAPVLWRARRLMVVMMIMRIIMTMMLMMMMMMTIIVQALSGVPVHVVFARRQRCSARGDLTHHCDDSHGVPT